VIGNKELKVKTGTSPPKKRKQKDAKVRKDNKVTAEDDNNN